MDIRQPSHSAMALKEQIPLQRDLPPPYWQYPSQLSTSSYQPLVMSMSPPEETGKSVWNPMVWGCRRWSALVVVILVIVLAVVLGAVLGVRANRYPDYSKLAYALKDTYEGQSFFDSFDYFTGYDPAHGFVHYVDAPTAAAMNLTYASANSAILRVDKSDQNATTGRRSVRITSKNHYNSGLFVFDIIRSPYGCGTWPSVWLTDPANWPLNGEIDVLEGVNGANKGNQMTLHTTKDCKMNHKRKESALVLTTDCFNGTDANAGCGVRGAADTFGEQLNMNGGGVYAMELRTEGIRVWFFPRLSIPADITNGSSPDPSTWETALADFPSTGCDISSHFKNQSIIANIDLCGDWAGQPTVFNDQYGCQGTCSDWIAHQADSFQTAVWEFSSFKVYQAV